VACVTRLTLLNLEIAAATRVGGGLAEDTGERGLVRAESFGAGNSLTAEGATDGAHTTIADCDPKQIKLVTSGVPPLGPVVRVNNARDDLNVDGVGNADDPIRDVAHAGRYCRANNDEGAANVAIDINVGQQGGRIGLFMLRVGGLLLLSIVDPQFNRRDHGHSDGLDDGSAGFPQALSYTGVAARSFNRGGDGARGKTQRRSQSAVNRFVKVRLKRVKSGDKVEFRQL
jgi:hypothetical protein